MRRGDLLVLANLGAEPWQIATTGGVVLAWDERDAEGGTVLVPARSTTLLST
jgi:hypothetical protein